MSVTYAAIKWNRNKRGYDAAIVAGVVLYVGLFVAFGVGNWSGSIEVLFIRALGTCGLLMLHLVLCVGPLARLDRRFLPILYNRRHLGVATFLVGLAHATLATGYFHGFGQVNPLVSLLSSNTNFHSWTAFPFEILGLAALAILLLLAATSHDFWQKNLGPSVWKTLHMLVYGAYVLLIMHVILGVLQSERSPLFALLLALGCASVAALHLYTGWREHRHDQGALARNPDKNSPWVELAGVHEIPEARAKVVCLPGGERIALFRYNRRIAAVTNVCAHQRGPLGEGKVVDGCITCPWHGWEYRPENGRSPPPFQERIATFRVRVVQGRVFVDPVPLPPGTATPPALIEEDTHA